MRSWYIDLKNNRFFPSIVARLARMDTAPKLGQSYAVCLYVHVHIFICVWPGFSISKFSFKERGYFPI